MASSIQDSQVFKRLTDLLEDQEGIRLLLSYPRQSLEQLFTAQQSDIWSMLVQHFGADRSAADFDDDDESDDETTPTPKKRKRPNEEKKSRGNWPGFADIKSLQLPDVYARHIRDVGCDPENFLNDSIGLAHKIVAQGSDEADATLACFQYTCHLQSRGDKDRIRWLYSMLFWYDLTTLWHPRGCARAGDKMLEQIEDLVQDRLPKSVDVKPIKKWIIVGSKLNSICEAFGVGCLFFIEQLLTKQFFNKIYTHKSQGRDTAFRHLQNLDLGRKAEESRANELGQAIRLYPIGPFRAARLGQLAEQGDS